MTTDTVTFTGPSPRTESGTDPMTDDDQMKTAMAMAETRFIRRYREARDFERKCFRDMEYKREQLKEATSLHKRSVARLAGLLEPDQSLQQLEIIAEPMTDDDDDALSSHEPIGDDVEDEDAEREMDLPSDPDEDDALPLDNRDEIGEGPGAGGVEEEEVIFLADDQIAVSPDHLHGEIPEPRGEEPAATDSKRAARRKKSY